MNQSDIELRVGEIVEVSWPDRWQVYRRLQELDIRAWCAIDQPLRVEIDSAIAAVQLQSVLKQLVASRRDLVLWIERCWQID